MNDTTTPETLRARMVERIIARGAARGKRVAEAMRTVPRHLFVPHANMDDAYDDQAVIIKRDAEGAALSCASEPLIVAMMLDQLDVHPGQRILEIGAGTGYNAALLAHLAGPSGQVTTVDIDPEVTAHARSTLDATGNHRVTVITRDGARGAPEHAPYDRLIVTVGAWDLPPAWRHQLTPDGRAVVPLRWRGQTRSLAFTPTPGHWRSDSMQLCGFVPMIGQDGERHITIDSDGQVSLYWDSDQPINPAELDGVLDLPQTIQWSGAVVGADEPFDGVWLRLTATEPSTCRIATTPETVNSGRCTPAIASRSPALVEGRCLAYLTLRRLEQPTDQPRWELGAIGHGPHGPHLAAKICQQVRAWDRDRTAQPVIDAYPAGSTDEQASTGTTIAKPHTRLILRY